jgi:hypothetical protein
MTQQSRGATRVWGGHKVRTAVVTAGMMLGFAGPAWPDAEWTRDAANNRVNLSTPSDKVNLGVASPSKKLEVPAGGLQFAGPAINVEASTHPTSERATIGFGLDANNTNGWIMGQDLGGGGTRDFYLLNQIGGNTFNRLYISTGGGVGLGTTAPSWWAVPAFHVPLQIGTDCYTDSVTATSLGSGGAQNGGNRPSLFATTGPWGIEAVLGVGRKTPGQGGNPYKIGVAGIGIVDQPGGPGIEYTAWGGYFEGRRLPSATGTVFGVEIGAINQTPPSLEQSFFTPYLNSPALTGALWLSAGRRDLNTANPDVFDPVATAWDNNYALGIGVAAEIETQPNHPRFQKGIVFKDRAIRQDATGEFPAIEFPPSYKIQWYSNDSAVPPHVPDAYITSHGNQYLNLGGYVAVMKPLVNATVPVCSAGSGIPMTLGYCASSARYKDGIEPLRNALPVVEALQGVKFRWKADGRADYGLIAESVAEVVPELVTRDDQGQVQGVNYNGVTALNTEAIKELKAEKDRLEARVAAQEKELAELKALVRDALEVRKAVYGGPTQ